MEPYGAAVEILQSKDLAICRIIFFLAIMENFNTLSDYLRFCGSRSRLNPRNDFVKVVELGSWGEVNSFVENRMDGRIRPLYLLTWSISIVMRQNTLIPYA